MMEKDLQNKAVVELYMNDINSQQFFKLIAHIGDRQIKNNMAYEKYGKLSEWTYLYNSININVTQKQIKLFLEYLVKYYDNYLVRVDDNYALKTALKPDLKTEENFKFEYNIFIALNHYSTQTNIPAPPALV